MNRETRRILANTFSAVAFTDAGEFETAARMARVNDKPGRALAKLVRWWHTNLSAIAFAEAGEYETARRLLETTAADARKAEGLADFLDRVGLKAARVRYGTIAAGG